MAVAKSDNWIRRFEVTDPKKHKNGFTIYRVTSVIFPRSAPEALTKIVVWKRYNDFKKLYKCLKSYHKQWNIREDFPRLEKGNFFKRFEESIIKDRIGFALDFLNFIGRHQCLFTSDPFLQFFKNGYQISESTHENSEICDNGDTLNSTSNPRNNLSGDFRGVKSNDESMFVDCEDSDEDSTETLDTSESNSPIRHAIRHASSESDLETVAKNLETSSFSLGEGTIPEKEAMKSSEGITANVGIFHSNRTAIERFPAEPEDSNVPESCEGSQVQTSRRAGRDQNCEFEGELEAAFCFYKEAIARLKKGSQNDGVKLWRRSLEEKAKHRTKSFDSSSAAKTDVSEDLKTYKVLGIIDSVMLVLNESDGKCYVIKVLEKSPCPIDVGKKTVVPTGVPCMIKLHRYFENESSIFLVLDYAKGGKLWDRLRDRSDSDYVGSERERESDLEESFRRGAKEKDVFGGFCPRSMDFALLARSPVEGSAACQENSPTEKNEGGKAEFKARETECLEVADLVENSQKLLNSVSQTLRNCKKMTGILSNELTHVEMAFGSTWNPEKSDSKRRRGRRSKSVASKPKMEKSHSSENLSDSRPRTASSSLDRRGEKSRTSPPAKFAPRPSESDVRLWAGRILLALESLHGHGIIFRDLHPGNILLDEEGNVVLSFQGQWRDVDSLVSEEAAAGFYAAPETVSVFPITPAVDWWSFGALLHELLTGMPLSSCYPEGISRHTILEFPDFLSPEAASLLSGLLRYDPGERLGSSGNGAEDLKCHPFFASIDW